MKDLLLWGRVVVRTSKLKIFTSLFGGLRQKIAPKSVLHVQHDYFFSFIQSNHRFVMLPLLSSFLKLPQGVIYQSRQRGFSLQYT